MDELSHELSTVQLDRARTLDAVLPRLRAFVELDTLLVFCPEERLSGWGIALLETNNLPNASRFAATLNGFLAQAPQRFWFFDPVSPETDQRDLVIETAAHVGNTIYCASPIYRDVLQPLHLGAHRELRALICDGPALLGWVGGFHDGPITPSQRARLAALLPALRRRLSADRVLRSQQLTMAAIATALDHLDDAAFVLGPRGQVAFVNHAARTRLRLDRTNTLDALGATDACDRIERVPLRCEGIPPHTLVVLRRAAEVERCAARVQRAADRWRLTRRQREVLQLVIRGRGNASIAEELGIGERTVELHVTAILDRACVNSRTSLVALVLGALALG